MHSPLQSHFEAALKVLRYLKSAPGACIVYTMSINKSVSAYADSDWAKCKMTRRSSAEAEYRSMASVTCEVMWIVKILKDLNFKDVIPVSLFCDNSSAIQTAANPVMHEKTKHFDVDVHLIREKSGFRFNKGS
ncbi:ribonuclease H-like domain-containing protein [Tanacetum coccineum]